MLKSGWPRFSFLCRRRRQVEFSAAGVKGGSAGTRLVITYPYVTVNYSIYTSMIYIYIPPYTAYQQ